MLLQLSKSMERVKKTKPRLTEQHKLASVNSLARYPHITALSETQNPTAHLPRYQPTLWEHCEHAMALLKHKKTAIGRSSSVTGCKFVMTSHVHLQLVVAKQQASDQ